MNTPRIFNFEQKEIRTLLINEEPFFVGKDVAEAIGYKNYRDALNKHVKQKYRRVSQITTTSGIQEMTIISEPGLYQITSESKLPSAEPFQDWVYEDVLPTIRKHGMYAKEELLNNPDLLIEVASKLKEERMLRLVAEQKVSELQSKADYYDNILKNPGLVTISTISKNYGMSAKKFNQLLHDLGIQFNQSGTWLLYSKYQAKRYTHIEPFDYKDSNGRERVKTRMKWTQKGHIFLYQELKKNGILPMIELDDIA